MTWTHIEVSVNRVLRGLNMTTDTEKNEAVPKYIASKEPDGSIDYNKLNPSY